MEEFLDERIKFDTAKLARRKGFLWMHMSSIDDESIKFSGIKGHDTSCYNEEGEEINPKLFNLKNPHYPRPTQTMMLRWLREIKGIFISSEIDLTMEPKFCYRIFKYEEYRMINLIENDFSDLFYTPEQAYEDAILTALNYLPDPLYIV